MKFKAPEILDHAKRLHEVRGETRDAPDGKPMAKAVAMFNALRGDDMTEAEGYQFLELLKMARASQGRFCIDDYVDGAAYAAMAGEAAAERNESKEVPMMFGPCNVGE